VKGFLSFSSLAFDNVPADVTASKLCEDSIFGNSVYRICGFILVKKLATLGYVVGVFLSLKFKFAF